MGGATPEFSRSAEYPLCVLGAVFEALLLDEELAFDPLGEFPPIRRELNIETMMALAMCLMFVL